MEPVRESIFISVIRSFCKAFAIIIGIFVAFIPIMFFFASITKDADVNDKTKLEILPDLNGTTKVLPLSTPAILQINVHGVIGDVNLKQSAQDFRNQLIESRKGILKNDRVKGILLHLRTPGGSAVDSDTIYRLIEEYKQIYNVPVYAYIDGLCASGGMYIAAAADKIYSNPVGIIGSIGVIVGPFFNVTEALEKIGVDSVTLTEGKDKDMLNPFRKWKPGEDQSLKNISAYLYEVFVDTVVKNRPRLDKQKLINDYGAQVFDPPTAAHLGYIDIPNSSYTDVLADLLQAANIQKDAKYQVVELKPKKNWFADLASTCAPIFSGKMKHIFQFGEKPHDLTDSFSYIYEPGIQDPIILK